ncbi:hypothetical protein B4114_0327 [Geobacillus stearothermophilus]|uniref:Uncharacterized protein n=1 Tax=Geobacillus stearothermophilus TaxID=1422 RepID=A0A150NDH7_GEOSE|nr:hypothetical protein B4114_0327 [Geobacillus stearothermophilus]
MAGRLEKRGDKRVRLDGEIVAGSTVLESETVFAKMAYMDEKGGS